MSVKIIAELGINHNGCIETAKQMATTAKECGADLVKLQKRYIDQCYTREQLDAPCRSPWGSTVREKVVGRELSWGDLEDFSDHCESIGVGWGCSCFDLGSLANLEMVFGGRIAFHKVPSAMAVHMEFLKQIASYGRLTLVSCGLASNGDDLKRVASVFRDVSTDYVMNVTTSIYPCPVDRCNLRRISAMLGEFIHWRCCRGVGYSGHEVGILPSVIAAHLGASYIERHFTLDRSWYGADQSASLEPEGLRRLVRDIRELDEIMGDSEIRLYGDEKNPVPRLMG